MTRSCFENSAEAVQQPGASSGVGGPFISLIKRRSSAASGVSIDLSSGAGGGGGGGQANTAASRLDSAQGSGSLSSDLRHTQQSGLGAGGLLESLERATSAGGRSVLPLTPPSSPAAAATPHHPLPIADRSAKGLAAAMSSSGAAEPPFWREVFRFLRNPHKVRYKLMFIYCTISQYDMLHGSIGPSPWIT